MSKAPKVHLPSAPDYDAPGFEPLHRGPLREGIARLYADAGCIATPMFDEDGEPIMNAAGKQKWHVNPSQVGVTWAWVLVDAAGQEVERASGSLLCPIMDEGKTYSAQSDLAEFYALLKGLYRLPIGLHVELATDNLLTIHRMFHQYPTRSIPPRWVRAAAARRQILMSRGALLKPVHLKGHPLKEWLARGHTGDDTRPGFPVSEWNDVCDKLCQAESKKVLEARRADEGQAQEQEQGQGQAEATAGDAGSAEGGADCAAAE